MVNTAILPVLCLGLVVLMKGIVPLQGQEITALRLTGRTRDSDGRLEVLVAGQWGTVCDDSFTEASATVVCRSLGFLQNLNANPEVVSKAESTVWFRSLSTNLPILVDDVACLGNESSLNDCPHRPFGQHNCDHYEDVAISCVQQSITSIRLAGGENERQGRLEVLVAGQWGMVCDDVFNNRAADVACRQLGYLTNTSRLVSTLFWPPSNTSQILLDDVRCFGNESNLDDCRHWRIGDHDCRQTESVAIICGGPFRRYSIRIVDGPSEYEGRLEVRVNGIWGTICGRRFPPYDVNAPCTMLGFERYVQGSMSRNAVYGKGDGPVYAFDCILGANDLNDCFPTDISSSCAHRFDVGIRCYDRDKETNGCQPGTFERFDSYHMKEIDE